MAEKEKPKSDEDINTNENTKKTRGYTELFSDIKTSKYLLDMITQKK